jgi:hypothetical protein
MENKINRIAAYGVWITLACCFNTLCHAQNAASAPPSNWNDTFIGARYADGFYFPGSAQKVEQKIATLNSVGGFSYGNYTFNVDYLVSGKTNPEANGNEGAREIYSISRVAWSGSKITGRPMNIGIIQDIGLTMGYDLNSKNDLYGSAGRTWILGPSVQFALPRGFWNLMAGWSKESNHNGIAHADVVYSSSWRAESAWNAPVSLGTVPAVFKGFISVTGPKGLDGFHFQTKTETLARMSFLVDVGALIGRPRSAYAGVGYEYWKNMFGTPPIEANGTRRSAATVNAEIHF